MKTKDFWIVAFLFVVYFAISYGYSFQEAQQQLKKDAIKANVAHYNPDTGYFQWGD